MRAKGQIEAWWRVSSGGRKESDGRARTVGWRSDPAARCCTPAAEIPSDHRINATALESVTRGHTITLSDRTASAGRSSFLLHSSVPPSPLPNVPGDLARSVNFDVHQLMTVITSLNTCVTWISIISITWISVISTCVTSISVISTWISEDFLQLFASI